MPIRTSVRPCIPNRKPVRAKATAGLHSQQPVMHNLPGLQRGVILSLRGQIQIAIPNPPGRAVIIPGLQIPEAPGAVTPGHPARVAADHHQEHALILLRHAQAAADQQPGHPAADPEESGRNDQFPLNRGINTINVFNISSNETICYHSLARFSVFLPRNLPK